MILMKHLLILLSVLAVSSLFSQQWNYDNDFNTQHVIDGRIDRICVQDDGKYLVAGFFSIVNTPITSIYLARLNSDGTLDTTFTPLLNFNLTNTRMVMALQTDGKIILGGNQLSRLLPDGSQDTSFNTNTQGLTCSIKSIAVQNDGKILVGGSGFAIQAVTSDDNLLRFKQNGSVDTTFNLAQLGTINSSISINVIHLLPDGKFYFGGLFGYSLDGYCLARADTFGNIDTTFECTLGFSEVFDIAIKPDGKLLVGCSDGIKQFSSNGSLDLTFNPPVISNNVFAIQLLPNEEIVIGGNFNNVNGMGGTALATILTANGDLSSNNFIYSHSTGNLPGVYDLLLETNGDLTIVGDFRPQSNFDDDINRYSAEAVGLDFDQFVLPSAVDSCNGAVYVYATGTPPFSFNLGNATPVIVSDNEVYFDSLCPGVYSLLTTDGFGDTLTSQVVIATDSSYFFNDPYTNFSAIDSLGAVLTDCYISYNQIDTAFIHEISLLVDTAVVVWEIISASGISYDTAVYILENGNGIYWLQAEIYCPFKSVGEYMVVTQSIYRIGTNVFTSTLDVEETVSINPSIFPNPTNGFVTVICDQEEAILTLIDLNGRILLTRVFQDKTVISLENQGSGIYFLNLEGNKGVSQTRLMKY